MDSLLSNYSPPSILKINEQEINFWKKRIDPKIPGIVNELKYSGALMTRFQFLGDINDVKAADSVLKKIDADYDHKEASPNIGLVRHYILQHRFKEADSLLAVATAIGLKRYEFLTTSFDVNFELGRYSLAAAGLHSMRAANDYGYNFRRSKLEHYKGDLDSSISVMLRAADAAGSDVYLKQAALSNAADLYIHADNLENAYELYVESIHLNPADLHSLTGIGWIALAHDGNDSLAERIFQFVHSRTKSPDPVFKLIQVAQARGDSLLEKKYISEFITQVTDPLYGNMYNKYLIELYTGSLHDPAKAEAIAKKELENRANPQTYSWYVWTLFCNNKKGEAYKTFEKFVSGKPLEGLELYWMGKLMQGLDKGYNAQQFFEAAYKNKYDLTPGKVKDIEKVLLK